MVGSGENKKSLAYIGNIIEFLETCISTDQKYGVYNYVDTPDLTMNELVSQVRDKLMYKKDIKIRLPYWFGMLIGYMADFISKITKINLPVSSIRVKKFASSTQFSSEKSSLDNFIAPFSLQNGIDRTLQSEFILPDCDKEIFYTE